MLSHREFWEGTWMNGHDGAKVISDFEALKVLLLCGPRRYFVVPGILSPWMFNFYEKKQ